MSRTVLSTDINHIMDNIDYHEIHNVMTLLDWTWLNSMGVPSVEEMKKLSSEILNKAAGMASIGDEGRTYMVETGGFRAEATLEDGDIYLRLTFALESWDNYDQFEDRLS